jgi:hypothetical protein
MSPTGARRAINPGHCSFLWEPAIGHTPLPDSPKMATSDIEPSGKEKESVRHATDKILSNVHSLSDLTEDVVRAIREILTEPLEIRKFSVTPTSFQQMAGRRGRGHQAS